VSSTAQSGPPIAAGGARAQNPLARLRLIATHGLAFALFGIASLVVFGVVLPIRLLLARGAAPRDLVAQRLVHRSLRVYLRVCEAIGAFRVESRHAERLAAVPALVVANHPTLLDVVLLLAHMPQADCIAKRAVWRNPFLRLVVEAAAYIPNDTAEDLVVRCCERLAAGRSVILFPEGSRSPLEGLREFQRGAAHIALASRCPVVPTLLYCDPPALKKGQPWYAVPSEPMRFRLEVDPPLRDLTEGLDALPRSLAARRVNQRLRDYFERRLRNGCAP
jgi:1-acyl-sn-glycerol-3-phosphate acyltransferase